MKIAAFVVAGLAVASANASVTLSQWVLLGAPGNQASTAGSGAPANITAGSLTRGAGLAGSTASNSFSSSGFTGETTDYVSFGFNVDAGFSVNLDSIYIGTRSSNTGPGTIGLFYNGDGFTNALATISQAPGNNFVNSILDVSALTGLTGNVEFRLYAIGSTAANGGSTSSSGTFRVTAYFENGAFNRDFQITGTVVPTPGALALLGLGGLVATRRRRA